MRTIRNILDKLATIGGLRRRGLSALSSYGGTITGEGEVTHKTGERAGTVTPFTLNGTINKTRKSRGERGN